jgi:hypothetical protein
MANSPTDQALVRLVIPVTRGLDHACVRMAEQLTVAQHLAPGGLRHQHDGPTGSCTRDDSRSAS